MPWDGVGGKRVGSWTQGAGDRFLEQLPRRLGGGGGVAEGVQSVSYSFDRFSENRRPLQFDGRHYTKNMIAFILARPYSPPGEKDISWRISLESDVKGIFILECESRLSKSKPVLRAYGFTSVNSNNTPFPVP